MNTIEIKNTLINNRTTKKCFFKVCAADELLKIKLNKIQKPSVIIANTDDSTGPGVHWVAFYIPKNINSTPEYFDSFGQSLNAYNNLFKKFLSTYYRKYRCNLTQIQGNLSTVCGHYCCIYALYKCGKFSLNKFMKLFPWKDFRKNDTNVRKLFDKYFKKTPGENKITQKLCFPMQKCFPRSSKKSIKRQPNK